MNILKKIGLSPRNSMLLYMILIYFFMFTIAWSIVNDTSLRFTKPIQTVIKKVNQFNKGYFDINMEELKQGMVEGEGNERIATVFSPAFV